jgi:serine/threonine protein kinase
MRKKWHLNEEALIGEGAYSRVYAVDEYALKRNLVETCISFVVSVKEMDLLLALSAHPYISKLLEVVDDTAVVGSPLLCAKCCKTGKTHSRSCLRCNGRRNDRLHFLLERSIGDIAQYSSIHSMSHEQLQRFMLQLLVVTDYLHANDIIHRDIKNTNVLVSQGRGGASVRLCDFGMAKIHTSRDRNTPSVCTVAFRAPEVCLGSHYDSKMDVWSLACTFYECITRHPFIVARLDANNEDLLREIAASMDDIEDIPAVYLARTRRRRIPFRERFKAGVVPLTTQQLDNLTDLLRGMFKWLPNKRFTTEQCIRHPFFADTYQADIDDVLKMNRSKPLFPVAVARYGIHRKRVAQLLDDILRICTPRVVFHALDIYDRYTDEGSETEIAVCLYLFVKYFSTVSMPPTYASFVGRLPLVSSVRDAEKAEASILTTLQNRLYRTTLYELSRLDPATLLKRYIDDEEVSGLDHEQIRARYEA